MMLIVNHYLIHKILTFVNQYIFNGLCKIKTSQCLLDIMYILVKPSIQLTKSKDCFYIIAIKTSDAHTIDK